MSHPGFGGAERTPIDGKAGVPDGQDATLEVGNYTDTLFGVSIPQSTGAPGSQGASGTADPTLQPGQLNEGLSGEGPDDTANTGAPGSTPSDRPDGGSTVTFTSPGGFLNGGDEQVTVTGNVSTWTEAGPSQYTGGTNLPGIPSFGLNDTGAGSGSVMRGGRAVG